MAPCASPGRGGRYTIHVLVLNAAYDPADPTPGALLDHLYNVAGWAVGLQAAGARVTVLQHFHQDAAVAHQGVRFRFVASAMPPMPRPWHAAHRLVAAAVEVANAAPEDGQPRIIHLNGLIFPVLAWWTRRRLPAAWALAVQHHAEQPRPGWRRRLLQFGLAGAAGFLFTHPAQAHSWQEAGIIRPHQPVYDVMEGSSPFAWRPRAVARGETGLSGRPILLWTGNLTANKDPLTVLAGFAQLLTSYPAARLYMAYRESALLPQVQAAIRQRPQLQGTVTLLGEIPHRRLASFYNSADLFVQGSAREGSGMAVLDALACGVPPVITNIPSFRTLTDDGRVGALWPVGDVDAFVAALHRVLAEAPEPATVADYFQRRWSFTAVGRRAVAVYEDLYRHQAASLRPGRWEG